MRVVLVNEEAGQFEALRQAVQGLGLECAAADCVSYDNLCHRLAQASSPDLIVVLVGGDEEAALRAIRYASANAPGPVLAAGTAREPREQAVALGGGARRYLDRGRLREELSAALEDLTRNEVVKAHRGRLIAVTGVNPGSGVTTVASSLAFALAAAHPGQVLLAEVGDGVPELALDLDLVVKHPVGELLEHWQRSDARMLKQARIEHPAGVHVLAQPSEALAPVAVSPEALRHLLVLMRALYDLSVLDLGHSAAGAALEAMRVAESVVVVVRLDVPALRLARKYLHELRAREVSLDKVRVVANRYGQKKQVAWKKAEEVLGAPVVEWVPDDPATVNQALNQGRPLVQVGRRAKITRSFDRLAAQLNGKVK